MSHPDDLLPPRHRALAESIKETLRFLRRGSLDEDPLKAIGFLELRYLLQAELERVRERGRCALSTDQPEAAAAAGAGQ